MFTPSKRAQNATKHLLIDKAAFTDLTVVLSEFCFLQYKQVPSCHYPVKGVDFLEGQYVYMVWLR